MPLQLPTRGAVLTRQAGMRLAQDPCWLSRQKILATNPSPSPPQPPSPTPRQACVNANPTPYQETLADPLPPRLFCTVLQSGADSRCHCRAVLRWFDMRSRFLTRQRTEAKADPKTRSNGLSKVRSLTASAIFSYCECHVGRSRFFIIFSAEPVCPPACRDSDAPARVSVPIMLTPPPPEAFERHTPKRRPETRFVAACPRRTRCGKRLNPRWRRTTGHTSGKRTRHGNQHCVRRRPCN
jgi:hypothetical protein